MRITDQIKTEIIHLSEKYKSESEDKYDFWEEHIKFVTREALFLALKYGADAEIVELAALLHDAALMSKTGTRNEHHINGAVIADSMLSKYNYPREKIDKVKKSIHNHRSSKNATDIEDICVADADIIAHFDNIPMLFNVIMKNMRSNKDENFSLNELRRKMIESFEYDYNDLSERTKQVFNEKYILIRQIVLGV